MLEEGSGAGGSWVGVVGVISTTVRVILHQKTSKK
jgi:hypothetical protein